MPRLLRAFMHYHRIRKILSQKIISVEGYYESCLRLQEFSAKLYGVEPEELKRLVTLKH
jgi:hypothetical protein